VIRSTGRGIPDQVMTNDDLAKFVETNHDWIVQRTGIHERRVCRDDETASTLSITAGREALERGNVDPSEIDLVVCATVTGDMLFPATSCLIQDALGIKNAGAFDLGAACGGFIYSLSVVSAMIEAGHINKALIIGVDVLTKFMDWQDRSTCVLFGDGAGAAVLEAQENTDRGVLHTFLMADGSGGKFICMEGGGSKHPAGRPGFDQVSPYIYMAGAEVYRFAVGAMGDACLKLLAQAGMTAADIDLFVPHQANLRIIKSAADKLGLPDEKVFINVEKYGNTSGGSIPLALYEAEVAGRLKPGMVVMTVGFGAGLVWGANLIRW